MSRPPSSAEGVKWSVGGEPKGNATGSSINWDFTWDLDKPDGTPLYHDCTYVVQADAFDSQDRAGTPRARTVILNRRAPVAPTGLRRRPQRLGRLRGPPVGPEPRVRRQGLPRVPQHDRRRPRKRDHLHRRDRPTITEDIKCLDDPPAGWQFYTVVALDLPTGSSTPREGDPSTQIAVGDPSDRPPAPTNVSLCVGDGSTGCVDAGGDRRPDGHGRGELGPVDRSATASSSTASTATARRSRTATTTSSPAQPPRATPGSSSTRRAGRTPTT